MSYTVNEARYDLDCISETISLYDKMIKVSAIVTKLMSEHVKQSDLPIIVGGLSMEIYTNSKYTTHDIDFVTSASKLMKEKLIDIGFIDNERIFIHERLNVAIDLVDTVLEPPDYDRMTKIELEDGYYVLVQSIENILYDRLLDYSRADNIRYGIWLITTRYDEIDFNYLRDELDKADPKALESLEQWVERAREELE